MAIREAPPREAPAEAADDLDRLRRRAEAFTVELNRAFYESLAGLRDEPRLEAIYARYPDLFTPARVVAVAAARGRAPEVTDEARRLAFLEDFLASGYEEERSKEADERYLAAEAAAVVGVHGQEIPYRSLTVRLRNTADRDRRRAIQEAAREVARSLQPHLRDALEASHAAAAELGGADYTAWHARLSGFDVGGLLERTGRLLAETEAPWRDLLDHFARRELGIGRTQVQAFDLPWLLRGGRFDADFPAEALVPSATSMVEAMGLDPTAGGHVEFDLEPRPRKSSRAFCSPIRVPAEIKLVILPSGGADDYRAFLHELGHSLHYGYADAAAPFEYRVLGDNSVTEAYAAAFDHCLMLPGWLRDVRGIAQPRDIVLLHWFEELFLLRRYAGKLRYELALHAAGPRPELADRYVEELGRAVEIAPVAERWLEDVDPRFYCVSYLQAWALCAALHRRLRERFDADWYRNPRTGPWLRDLFARGQRDRAPELAAELGSGGLDFDELLAWIAEGLDGTST